MMNVECFSSANSDSITVPRHPPPASSPILLIAVNARYSHTSYSVRSLKANLGELEDKCAILETELSITPYQLAAQIVEAGALIAGFSLYLWNRRLIEATVRILRATTPRIRLIAGGPELTVDYANADLFDLCVIGEGESAIREYCRNTLALKEGTAQQEPPRDFRIITTPPEDTKNLKIPFHLYTDEDIAHRVIYVEASRGCPYNCAYCTSASSGLRLIPLDKLLPALDDLWRRGVRKFKFLDRSFTASRDHAHAVMRFFRDRATPGTTLHFEINTDRLTAQALDLIAAFPADVLHLECGIQTLNPAVALKVGRSPDVETTIANLRFLVQESGADVHADLIFGLPGEDEASFAEGFNRVVNTCTPPVIQVNLLKGLPGTGLTTNPEFRKLLFNAEPPYELLESDRMDFGTLTRMQRFARCVELVYNRTGFETETNRLISLSENVYGTFMRLSGFIHAAEGRMHRIAQSQLKTLINTFADSHRGTEVTENGQPL